MVCYSEVKWILNKKNKEFLSAEETVDGNFGNLIIFVCFHAFPVNKMINECRECHILKRNLMENLFLCSDIWRSFIFFYVY